MKAFAVTGPGAFKFVEIDIPEIDDYEVPLVRLSRSAKGFVTISLGTALSVPMLAQRAMTAPTIPHGAPLPSTALRAIITP